jgi:pectin methylesterase-like acyl-CoA thioesterase
MFAKRFQNRHKQNRAGGPPPPLAPPLRLLLASLVLGGLLLPSACAFGATYYVATTGLDTNPGTQTAPFQTIQKAADVVQPGDTVIVKAGTYRERVTMKTSGMAGKPITFQGGAGRGD